MASVEVDRILKCKPKDFFSVLAIDIATATYEDVKRAHKKVVLQVHPDKCPDDPRAKDAFAVADAAYKDLSVETSFNRYKDAFDRKAAASAAAKNFAAGKGLSKDQEAKLHDVRVKEEAYQAAVRIHKEQEQKKHRTEQEKKQSDAASKEIEEQKEEYGRMIHTMGASKVTTTARFAGAAVKPTQR